MPKTISRVTSQKIFELHPKINEKWVMDCKKSNRFLDLDRKIQLLSYKLSINKDVTTSNNEY